jgi:glycosyltransferase involved in cell wall biosynthesis
VAILEPWFGESHAAFFSGIAKHAKANCELIALPPRKWRWRMRFGAAHLAKKMRAMATFPDALLLSDYVHLPALIGLYPKLADIPSTVYFLENQLTYPVRPGEKRDFEFMAINILTCLAATQVVFCSQNQMEAMLASVPGFLCNDPDANADDVIREIETKSHIIPIGIEFGLFDQAKKERKARTGKPLRLVWPHRFEHDKNPDDFFDVLRELAEEDLPFEISVLGRTYRDVPDGMTQARKKLANRIASWGFKEGKAYADALAASDVVVSTAWQETQGIAVIEAIRSGCDPLLPDRLSYPEVLGPELGKKHLYKSKGELRRRLRWMMKHPDRVRATADHAAEMDRFGWPAIAPQFDALLQSTACDTKGKAT